MSQGPVPGEPVREKRFSISHVDSDGCAREGSFLYRRSSYRDRFRIGAELQRMTEGLVLGDGLMNEAAMFAWLKTVVREVPPWFQWDAVEEGLLLRIFEEVDRIDGAWFRRHDAARSGASPGPGAPAGEERAAPVAPVVGAEVPPAADQH